MSLDRYVALGDSFTEGLGDVDPSRPHGLRGWADRVAEVLATGNPDFAYANLAIRGRKLDGILAEQIEPALALEPDLVTIYAGANDIMRPRVDLDLLLTRYGDAIARLTDSGAQVLVWTSADPGHSATYRLVHDRFRRYSDGVRALAARHGARVVDYWHLKEYADWRLWDSDRMHMGPAGHQRMAIEVLDTLGVPHDLAALPLPDHGPVPWHERLRTDATWARTFLVPWVHRRLTGRSSGDGMAPRYPEYTRIAPAHA
ncbi:GDSL-like Lipase/Acylhydrolase [Nocardioides dokdonensis FR1436]|uniref:GDSL-like Lipase/Acylhydrolase n=1 Tax=Nocardioides dokdonensis FR1436 TaxID=1300347 RepID=A0A1A9GIE4_9ACTN|nr:SGNH/GDSL hydrolase family protein [Nocardioides dokdonensis]ANH37432.1 GDSL-like Lipase/Acylhydrolase [Nocardioides dokdonensis FR1436]